MRTERLETVLEAVVTGVAGAALGWIALYPVDSWIGGAAAAGALTGGANGLVSGATGVYAWRKFGGWLSFLLDSTWGLIGVAGGLLLHLANLLHRNPSYRVEMSRRSNRHVYERGYSVRPGFALALGNVITGAGGAAGLRGDSSGAVRRRKLVDVHEGAHLIQNRLLGPFYPLSYLGWMLVAAVVGLVVSLARDRNHIWPIVETVAYYNNPFEYWAYRKDGYWPPRGAHPRYIWGRRRSPVRPANGARHSDDAGSEPAPKRAGSSLSSYYPPYGTVRHYQIGGPFPFLRAGPGPPPDASSRQRS